MKKFLIAMMTCFLAACTSLSGTAPQRVATEGIYRMGRFAVLVFDKLEDRNVDSVQGQFTWDQRGDNLQLNFSSPLGQTIAQVNVSPRVSTLTNSAGERWTARTPDELIERVMGQQMPVRALQYWIEGQVMPSLQVQNQQYDAQGRLSQFEQAGWRVDMSDYDGTGPQRLALVHNQTTQRISIRLSVQ